MTPYNLSDKIGGIMMGLPEGMIPVPDIKEFIKLLKNKIFLTTNLVLCKHCEHNAQEIINQLAGDKLI